MNPADFMFSLRAAKRSAATPARQTKPRKIASSEKKLKASRGTAPKEKVSSLPKEKVSVKKLPTKGKTLAKKLVIKMNFLSPAKEKDADEKDSKDEAIQQNEQIGEEGLEIDAPKTGSLGIEDVGDAYLPPKKKFKKKHNEEAEQVTCNDDDDDDEDIEVDDRKFVECEILGKNSEHMSETAPAVLINVDDVEDTELEKHEVHKLEGASVKPETKQVKSAKPAEEHKKKNKIKSSAELPEKVQSPPSKKLKLPKSHSKHAKNLPDKDAPKELVVKPALTPDQVEKTPLKSALKVRDVKEMPPIKLSKLFHSFDEALASADTCYSKTEMKRKSHSKVTESPSGVVHRKVVSMFGIPTPDDVTPRKRASSAPDAVESAKKSVTKQSKATQLSRKLSLDKLPTSAKSPRKVSFEKTLKHSEQVGRKYMAKTRLLEDCKPKLKLSSKKSPSVDAEKKKIKRTNNSVSDSEYSSLVNDSGNTMSGNILPQISKPTTSSLKDKREMDEKHQETNREDANLSAVSDKQSNCLKLSDMVNNINVSLETPLLSAIPGQDNLNDAETLLSKPTDGDLQINIETLDTNEQEPATMQTEVANDSLSAKDNECVPTQERDDGLVLHSAEVASSVTKNDPDLLGAQVDGCKTCDPEKLVAGRVSDEKVEGIVLDMEATSAEDSSHQQDIEALTVVNDLNVDDSVADNDSGENKTAEVSGNLLTDVHHQDECNASKVRVVADESDIIGIYETLDVDHVDSSDFHKGNEAVEQRIDDNIPSEENMSDDEDDIRDESISTEDDNDNEDSDIDEDDDDVDENGSVDEDDCVDECDAIEGNDVAELCGMVEQNEILDQNEVSEGSSFSKDDIVECGSPEPLHTVNSK